MSDEHIQIVLQTSKQTDEIIGSRNKEEEVLLAQKQQLMECVQSLTKDKQKLGKENQELKEENIILRQRIADLEKITITNNFNVEGNYIANQIYEQTNTALPHKTKRRNKQLNPFNNINQLQLWKA